MTKTEAKRAVADAGVVHRGDAWGETPVWSVTFPDGNSVDVHANDEDEARAAAAAFLEAEEA